jgi:hypothetical protein
MQAQKPAKLQFKAKVYLVRLSQYKNSSFTFFFFLVSIEKKLNALDT